MKSSSMINTVVWGSVFAVGTTGCDDTDEVTRLGFEVRDSAGIEIVQSASPALTKAAAWTIDPDPILEIGAIDAEDPYVFTRIWDATRFPDGRIAVVDEMTLEVRVFDAAGRHLDTFGGGGDGPGEFVGPPFVAASGPNALTAWDGGHLRLSWFTSAGELTEQVNMQPALSELGVNAFRNGLVWEIDADGTLLSTGPTRPERTDGLRDSYRHIASFGDRGATSHDFGNFLSGQSFVVRLERMSIGIGNPYGPFPAAGLVGGGRVAIGDGSRWEIRVHEADGTVARIIRASIPRRAVTEELREWGLERARDMAERSPLSRGQAEDAYAQIPLPDSVPPIATIKNANGTLWVGRRTGWWYESGDYDVFGEDGRWLTTVVMPADVARVHEIGDDYILAHVTDDLEVPFLRMYRILRDG